MHDELTSHRDTNRGPHECSRVITLIISCKERGSGFL